MPPSGAKEPQLGQHALDLELARPFAEELSQETARTLWVLLMPAGWDRAVLFCQVIFSQEEKLFHLEPAQVSPPPRRGVTRDLDSFGRADPGRAFGRDPARNEGSTERFCPRGRHGRLQGRAAPTRGQFYSFLPTLIFGLAARSRTCLPGFTLSCTNSHAAKLPVLTREESFSEVCFDRDVLAALASPPFISYLALVALFCELL